MALRADERIDYIGKKHLKIIQSKNVFTFSLDAVLLAYFVNVPKQKGKLVDLCAGNGVVPILLSQRSYGDIFAVEIQETLCDMAARSVRLNDLDERITILCKDINDLRDTLGNDSFDVVTCNPPYFKTTSESDVKRNRSMAIARHEIYCTLADVVRVASRLLKQGGKAAFVHRPNRLLELLTTMRAHHIEPKRLQFVHPKKGAEANIVLVEGAKAGKADLRVLPPITVYTKENRYTNEIREIINGT